MRYVLSLVLAATFSLLSTEAAWSCSCNFEAGEFDYAVRNNQLIFLGKLVKVNRVNGASGRFLSATYKFAPLKVWRGQPADTLTLRTDTSNCHILLSKGQTLVVYTDPDGELSICHRIIGHKISSEARRLDSVFPEAPQRPKREGKK